MLSTCQATGSQSALSCNSKQPVKMSVSFPLLLFTLSEPFSASSHSFYLLLVDASYGVSRVGIGNGLIVHKTSALAIIPDDVIFSFRRLCSLPDIFSHSPCLKPPFRFLLLQPGLFSPDKSISLLKWFFQWSSIISAMQKQFCQVYNNTSKACRRGYSWPAKLFSFWVFSLPSSLTKLNVWSTE